MSSDQEMKTSWLVFVYEMHQQDPNLYGKLAIINGNFPTHKSADSLMQNTCAIFGCWLKF